MISCLLKRWRWWRGFVYLMNIWQLPNFKFWKLWEHSDATNSYLIVWSRILSIVISILIHQFNMNIMLSWLCIGTLFKIVIINIYIFASTNFEGTEFKHIFDNIHINRFLNVFSLFLFWNLFCRAISTSAKVLTKCLLLDISKSNLFHNMRWCFLKTYKR